jgi:hypothetical protein
MMEDEVAWRQKDNAIGSGGKIARRESYITEAWEWDMNVTR